MVRDKSLLTYYQRVLLPENSNRILKLFTDNKKAITFAMAFDIRLIFH